jgi:hypothetical protein
MFRSRCQRSFAKIMLVTIKMQLNNISFSIFEIQKLFNSETNHECNCPFCNNTALTILKTNLLLGSAFELNYSELCQDSKHIQTGFMPGT